jgi:hypothetical protein
MRGNREARTTALRTTAKSRRALCRALVFLGSIYA